VGNSAQFANMDISQSELIDQIRKNDAGVWAGESPTDKVPRIIAYQHIPGRDMGVIVGIAAVDANQPLYDLAAMARGLAMVATAIMLTIAAILIWTIATTQAAKQRKKNSERTELNLMNARQEIALARARAMLTEPEAGALLSSPTDGVARLDGEQRLRLWNRRFAELTGMPFDGSAAGTPIEELFRLQAKAGLFGEPEDAEQEVATRLTILHTSGQSVVPPMQLGPSGEQITMHVRGVADGGNLIILAGPENARLAALPTLAAESEPETADEATEW
jgi:histidine kinase